jgi:hypothetical protein
MKRRRKGGRKGDDGIRDHGGGWRKIGKPLAGLSYLLLLKQVVSPVMVP